jgi:hypothetical protein
VKYLILPLLSILVLGCGSINTQERDSGNDPHINELLGAWYFYMGKNGHIKLNLKADHKFDISVIPCSQDEELEKPSGSWSLKGNYFQLLWPDGRQKMQEVVEVSSCALKLTSQTGYERYRRNLGKCSS